MKYYVMPDLNDPSKTKVEKRSNANGSICELPRELIGSAYKIIDEIIPNTNGQTRKAAVLDVERDLILKEKEREIEDKIIKYKNKKEARINLIKDNKDKIDKLTLTNLKPIIKALVEEVFGE